MNLSARRNIRNALIRPKQDHWEILGPPEKSENVTVEKFWEDTSDDRDGHSGYDDFVGIEDDLSVPGIDEDLRVPDDSSPLVALPRGITESKLAQKAFDRCYVRCKRMQEYFYNLKIACGSKPEQMDFVRQWLPKLPMLNDIEACLGKIESGIVKAAGGAGTSLPTLLDLSTVRAANKIGGRAVHEAKPLDAREKRNRRKRQREVTTKLAKLQTPLVEANRPNKHKESERCRQQEMYLKRRKKRKLPSQFHPRLESQRDEEKEPIPH